MTHAELSRTGPPSIRSDCTGQLAQVGHPRRVTHRGRTAFQTTYRCTHCGATLGQVEGTARWVDAGAVGTSGATGGARSGPGPWPTGGGLA
jgi:hypothetical protein